MPAMFDHLEESFSSKELLLAQNVLPACEKLVCPLLKRLVKPLVIASNTPLGLSGSVSVSTVV